MQHIFGSFPAILKEIDADEPIVFAAWKRCVDGALAENVVPVRIENRRLIAAVPSETWRRNVADLGPALTAKINVAIGSKLIRFIEFQVNAAAVREHRRCLEETRSREVNRSDTADRIAASLTPAANRIADEQLRKRFLAAAANSLARGEKLEASE